jgi:hypothetical protein
MVVSGWCVRSEAPEGFQLVRRKVMATRNGTSNGVHNGTEPTDHVLTRAQIVAALEEESQSRRGMSAAQLIRAYKTGKLDDPGEVADILGLASLLRKGDPLFVRS